MLQAAIAEQIHCVFSRFSRKRIWRRVFRSERLVFVIMIGRLVTLLCIEAAPAKYLLIFVEEQLFNLMFYSRSHPKLYFADLKSRNVFCVRAWIDAERSRIDTLTRIILEFVSVSTLQGRKQTNGASCHLFLGSGHVQKPEASTNLLWERKPCFGWAVSGANEILIFTKKKFNDMNERHLLESMKNYKGR